MKKKRSKKKREKLLEEYHKSLAQAIQNLSNLSLEMEHKKLENEGYEELEQVMDTEDEEYEELEAVKDNKALAWEASENEVYEELEQEMERDDKKNEDRTWPSTSMKASHRESSKEQKRFYHR